MPGRGGNWGGGFDLHFFALRHRRQSLIDEIPLRIDFHSSVPVYKCLMLSIS